MKASGETHWQSCLAHWLSHIVEHCTTGGFIKYMYLIIHLHFHFVSFSFNEHDFMFEMECQRGQKLKCCSSKLPTPGINLKLWIIKTDNFRDLIFKKCWWETIVYFIKPCSVRFVHNTMVATSVNWLNFELLAKKPHRILKVRII